jgi:hypothetical protein
MTGAEQAITAESPPKHRLLPGAIVLSRAGREHQCNWPKSDCTHIWHGPRACILEANGFVAFANGADLAEVCKLWQFPPPPPSSSPHPSDPAGVGISPVAHDAKTGDTKSVPKQRPEDRSPPTNGTDQPKFEDGLESSVSPATQAASLSEDQRSWQTDIESRLISETKQVFVYQRSSPSHDFPCLARIFSIDLCRDNDHCQSHHHSWIKI